MIFGPREVKDYAQPVEAAELCTGHVYFSVQFLDEEMLIPLLEPLVFVGNDIDEPGEGQSYFQDVESYSAGIRIESSPPRDPLLLQCFPTKTLGNIYTYDHALDVLIGCWARRNKKIKSAD